MISRDDLVARLDALLEAPRFRDYGPNGLQVEGRPGISRVALGVSASLAFLRRAARWGADAAVVHHGLFWRGPEFLRVERSLRARLKLLLEEDLNLVAYHLPLDAHLEVGNNAVLAKKLGAQVVEQAFEEEGAPIGLVARLPRDFAAAEFFRLVADAVGREPLVIEGGSDRVRMLGVVAGRAPRFIEEAARRGLDAFLTGEPSEPAVHLAREEKIHLVAAGHHAMERLGVQALGAWMRAELDLETCFIDDDNPV